MNINVRNEYIGFKIKNKSLNEIYDILKEKKLEAVNIAKENIAKNASKEYESLTKTTNLTSGEVKNRIINNIMNSQDRIKKGFEQNFKWSYHLEFTLFPIDDGVLMLIKSDNFNAYKEFLFELNFEEYNYNTHEMGKPATVCQLDWNNRKKDWEKTGILSNAPIGLVFQMVQWTDYEKDMLNNKFFEKLISKKDCYFM